jgi:hypothetical protein
VTQVTTVGGTMAVSVLFLGGAVLFLAGVIVFALFANR